jgi:hypothetical protein
LTSTSFCRISLAALAPAARHERAADEIVRFMAAPEGGLIGSDEFG